MSMDQAGMDDVVGQIYDNWRSTLIVDVPGIPGGKAVRFGTSTEVLTVSEGMGYGMLLAVLMEGRDSGAQALFDGLFKTVRARPAYSVSPAFGGAYLMDWRLRLDGSSFGDGWNAMDGDLDIAMALLMADKQWGSAGAVNYKAEALATIGALKAQNMAPDGRTKGNANGDHSRTSDYMTGHFKAFARAGGDDFWNLAVDKSFALLNTMQSSFSPATGLLPDFIVGGSSPTPAPSPGYVVEGNANEGFYYWNACRLPWRLATDYVTSGDDRPRGVASKLTDFFQRVSGGQPSGITAGYKLDGAALSTYAAPAFIGPATAGAMVDARFQPFLDNLWTYSVNNRARGYYETELQLFSLIVASGNWWNP